MQPLFVLIAGLLKAWMRVMGWRVRVTGEEHLPDGGPAVLACNHVGYLDPVQVGWLADRHRKVPRFLAKQELFGHRLLGPVLRNLRQVPVDRSGDRSAVIPLAKERLEAGDWVIVFPESTISPSFVPAEPRTGAARLALETGAPLIPVALWGSHRILTKDRPRSLRRGIVWATRVGAPVRYDRDESPAAVTRRLWQAVRGLVDEAQRGYPQQPAGPDDRWWLPRHLGGTAPAPGGDEGRAPSTGARP